MSLLAGSRATFRGVCHNDSEVGGSAVEEGLVDDTGPSRNTAGQQRAHASKCPADLISKLANAEARVLEPTPDTFVVMM